MQIVLTVGIISGISGILAFLITLANRTVNDYGEVKITINESKEYDVRGGSSLLSLLVENEVYIPSACGGKGSCGFCKVKVEEGGGPLLPTETGYVTEEEAKDKGLPLLFLTCGKLNKLAEKHLEKSVRGQIIFKEL